MKVKIVILCFFIFIAAMDSHANVPVIDVAKILQDALHHIERIRLWLRYLKKIKRVRQVFSDTKNLYQYVYRSIVGRDIITVKDFADIVLRGHYITDPENRDTWSFIWKQLERLSGRFPELRDFEFLYKNRLYRENPVWRKYLDEVIESENERVDDLENLSDFLVDMRKFDSKRAWQFKLLQARADEYASRGETGRLIALLANLSVEKVRVQMQVNLLLRIFFEQHLKGKVRKKEAAKRFANYQKDNAGNWRLKK